VILILILCAIGYTLVQLTGYGIGIRSIIYLQSITVYSSSQIITTNLQTPNFLSARSPSCHPANSDRAL